MECYLCQTFQDWEVPTEVSFLDLYSHSPTRIGEDGLCWKLKQSGQFDVSSYRALRGFPRIQFPSKRIWRVKAPRRVSFFVCSVAWGKILTCDNLMCRGYSLTSWCCICGCNGETVNHLMLHCPVAAVLWNFVLRTFGVKWVSSGCVMGMLFGWRNWFGKHSSKVWNLVTLCLMWTIWAKEIGALLRTRLFLRANRWIVLLSPCLIGLGPRVSLLAFMLLNLLLLCLCL